jgi:hypothetical protein
MNDYAHLSDEELLRKLEEYKNSELVYNNRQASTKIRLFESGSHQ